MLVPSGTRTARPSIVRLMSFGAGGADCGAAAVVSAMTTLVGRHERGGRGAAHRTALAGDVRLELVTEFRDPGHDGRGAGVAEHADRLARHLLGDLEQGVEITHRSLPCLDAFEDLGRPRRAFAALRALRAALVGVEAREARDLTHHALRVVEADHSPRPEHGAAGDEALVVHQRAVALLESHDRDRGAARDDRLEAP